MGRKWNKKKKDTATNKVEKPKRERQDPQGYVEVKKENKDFEIYYKSQNLIPEEEWATFMQSLQSSLPAAFRVTGNTTQAKALLKILKDEYFKPLETMSAEDLSSLNIPFTETMNGNRSVARVVNGSTESPAPGAPAYGAEVAVDGAVEEPIVPLQPKCLTWYPDGLAYQLNLSRRSIRRCEAYWRLHQCLISETDAGGISRQEAVSMIPPLLLDVRPHHKVLDMCAAPGSKTAQIIEQLHGSHDPLEGSIPPGVVVANDADNKRCYLLTHQAKRLQSPSIMITNHDAAFMPNMFYTRPDGGTGRLKFDRVLCDVPCSGDGTLRKNCDVWAKWNPVNGCNLHGLQLRIARRGLELLAVGGRMVYSTCSLSPMENEAVLQRLLLEAGGAVTLQDCSQQLQGLKYRPGLTTWTVMTRDMAVLPTPAHIPIHLSNIYHRNLFPVEDDLHLERCLRLLPHHQDTGGFFVAVLHKLAPLPGEQEEGEGGCSQRCKQPPKKRRRQGFKEEPFYYLSDCIAQWERDYRAANEPSGTAAGDTVTAGDETAMEPSGTAAGDTVTAGDETAMEPSGTAAGDTVTAGDETAMEPSGTAAGDTVTAGDETAMEPSGTAAGDTVTAGDETAMEPSGTAAGDTVTAGGETAMEPSGTAAGDTVTAGDETAMEPSGTAAGDTVTAGDEAAMEPSGTAAGDTVTAGDVTVAGVSGDSTDNRVDSAHCPGESEEARALLGTVEASDGAASDNSLEDLRIWSTICTFFGFRKDVPEASFSNFMTRSKEGKKRNLYFTNSLVRDLIDHNQDRMKIINTGVKVLVRTDNKGATCDFRLAQEGVQSLVPLVTLRRVPVSRSDLVHLLTDDDNETPPELSLMSKECQQRAAGLVTGSVLLEYCGDPTVPEEQQQHLDQQNKMKIELVGWKGKNSMRCYVARNDRIHYLRLLRADTSRYVKNKFGAGRGPADEAMVTEGGLAESGAAVLEGGGRL